MCAGLGPSTRSGRRWVMPAAGTQAGMSFGGCAQVRGSEAAESPHRMHRLEKPLPSSRNPGITANQMGK